MTCGSDPCLVEAGQRSGTARTALPELRPNRVNGARAAGPTGAPPARPYPGVRPDGDRGIQHTEGRRQHARTERTRDSE